jgi:hypothetical protein
MVPGAIRQLALVAEEAADSRLSAASRMVTYTILRAVYIDL